MLLAKSLDMLYVSNQPNILKSSQKQIIYPLAVAVLCSWCHTIYPFLELSHSGINTIFLATNATQCRTPAYHAYYSIPRYFRLSLDFRFWYTYEVSPSVFFYEQRAPRISSTCPLTRWGTSTNIGTKNRIRFLEIHNLNSISLCSLQYGKPC